MEFHCEHRWCTLCGCQYSQYVPGNTLDRYEYMRMPIDLIPQEVINHYDLSPKIKNGYIYMEIIRGMYGLPQAGVLANKLLKERLSKHGYYEVPHTPGLF